MAYTTIDDPSAYFQTTLWTGDGNDDRSITNTGNSDLQPDFVWVKSRGTSNDHLLFDSNRGVGKYVRANDTNDETTIADTLQAFQSDGIQIGTDSRLNTNTDTVVSWQWKANGGTTTSNGASGDIKASVTQREDTAKFAICTYTGTGISAGQSHRVNHGLGTTPHVMLFKSIGASGDWVVYHHKNTDAPETDYLVLNSTAATADSANKFNDTAPNTSYATIGGDDNISSGTMVLYSFAEVQGYSKFGSYTGNADSNGPFIYTGFKPKFAIFKATSVAGEGWAIRDSARSPFNQMSHKLSANVAAVEGTAANDNDCDFLSNGIKLRSSSNQTNKSGVTFVYMAFAEHPFVSSEGVPTTAR